METGKIVAGVGVGMGALAAWWWWRRERGGAPGALGLTLPAWMTGARSSTSSTGLAIAAGRQTARALAGSPLSDYRQAEDQKLFWNTAEDDAAAYWKSAYWMAVASRIARDGNLARAAGANMVRGNWLGSLPGSGYKTGGISDIFTAAAKLVTQAAKGNRQLSSVAAVLARQADPGVIATWQQAVSEQSPAGIVKGTIEKSGEDVGTLAGVLRGIFTGDLPPGMSPTRWFFYKWGLRAALIAAGGLGLWLTFGVKAQRFATAAASIGQAGRTFATHARAALTATKAATE